ncbi:hypothetical protein [Jeotgalibacillus alimentarius]|uniref:hypothetical protein n=1 Tax=Jeotgalibacillus alimentarius TaxID=135826 RepID=UPI00126A54B3|nr:hypothetical protein [Jeotgalibacillus alimentarius]
MKINFRDTTTKVSYKTIPATDTTINPGVSDPGGGRRDHNQPQHDHERKKIPRLNAQDGGFIIL